MMELSVETYSRLAQRVPAQEQKADYQLVAQAIRFLETYHKEQPELEQLADHVHVSPYHLQRIFTRWAGISPKRFLQYLTIEHAKQLLEDSRSVLDAALDAGLSGPSRLHDLFVTVDGITPGEYKMQGAGLTITYGRHVTPFGDCLLAVTERGVNALAFVDDSQESWDNEIGRLAGRWPGAHLVESTQATARFADQIFSASSAANDSPLRLFVKGTNFQIKVWEALLRVPAGAVCSYADIARMIQRPSAARAVGSAVGANAIAYLIPCHRVILQNGLIRDYRWGSTRKKAILGWELAHAPDWGDRQL